MRRLLCGLPLVLAALSGCGTDGPPSASPSATIDFLPGERVGKLAEEQLEAEHPAMATGTVTCPDLDWELDASVRCLKISELSEGRRVKIPGTVTVTSIEGGGTLHVELDDRATEFGVDAGHLGSAAASWVRSQTGSAAVVTCPYLTGTAGAVVRCAATVADRDVGVLVRVTGVDAADYRTRFAFAWESGAPVSKASPTFVASAMPGVVD